MKIARLQLSQCIEERGRVFFLVLLLVPSAALFYLPEAWLDGLHLAQVAEQYRFYLGAAVLVSAILLMVEGVAWWDERKQNALSPRGWKRHRHWGSGSMGRQRQMTTTLTPGEQAVLREFAVQGLPTLHLPFEDPIVAGLLSKGVLRIAGRFARESVRGPLFPMTIAREGQALGTTWRMAGTDGRPAVSQQEPLGYGGR